MSSVAKKMVQAAAGNSVDANLEFIGYVHGQGTVTATRGVDYEDGDLLFNYMSRYPNTTIAPESGWTAINAGKYGSYQSFSFSYRIADASSYTTNNGNYGNTIVVFRPTGYTTFTQVSEDEGLNGATAAIQMTDTNDSLYMGFGSELGSGPVTTIQKPSFASENSGVTAGQAVRVKFYWAYQEAGHGNTGTQTLDVSGSFEACTALQLDLT